MRSRRKPMSEINVVPYIDVMLVLLVIFMATAPLLTQGIEINLPQKPSDPLSNDIDDPYVISVRKDGAIFVNVGMSNVDGTATRVTVYSLEDQISKILSARPEVPIYIRADAELPYGDVVDVMTALQKAGANDVGLITDPPQL